MKCAIMKCMAVVLFIVGLLCLLAWAACSLAKAHAVEEVQQFKRDCYAGSGTIQSCDEKAKALYGERD